MTVVWGFGGVSQDMTRKSTPDARGKDGARRKAHGTRGLVQAGLPGGAETAIVFSALISKTFGYNL